MLRENGSAKATMPAQVMEICVLLALFPLFLVSCDAGIFSNASWQASGLLNQQLRLIEVSRKASSTLYTGNAQGHIFASTTAGQNWHEQSNGLPLPNVIHALSFDSGGQKLYLATDEGIFTKTEGAMAWRKITAVGLPSTVFTALAFLPDNPNVVYVGTSDRGIFVSKDNGTSWTPSSDGMLQGIAVHDLSFDPIQKQLWAATSAGAYRSEKRGASWQSFNNGLPSSISVNTIVPASVGGGAQGLLYMGTNHGVFLSHDSGVHWTTSSEALSGVPIHRILVDFRSPNGATVYIATSVGVFQSTDSGQTWKSVASGLPKDAPVYTLIIGAANNAQLYAAGNGIYEFPGTGGSVDPTRIVTYLVVAVFFFLLYRLATRGRRAQRSILKPERDQKTPIAGPSDDSPRLS